MSSDILNLIERFSEYTIGVLGDAMLDCYLHGSSNRICREAPVPVVDVHHRENLPGGAGNTAVNIRSLGGQLIFLSVVGDDPDANLLMDALEERGVNTDHVIRDPSRITLSKTRVNAGDHMLVRFDQGSTKPIGKKVEQKLIQKLKEIFPKVNALIISDYDYGVLTPAVIDALEDLQSNNPRIIVVDSKKLPMFASIGVTAVKPNYEEAAALLGLSKNEPDDKRPDQIIDNGERILTEAGAQIAAITMDKCGAFVFEHGHAPYRTYAKPAPHSRAAGAGDTFLSTMTLALAAGAATSVAAELASGAASVIVEKPGTSACYKEDLISFFSQNDKLVTDPYYLAARIASARRMGKRIVFTNGCFDILHRGHVTYLNKAKAYGDMLIVGLNSDASVRRLKGKERPINSLEDRSQVLAALSCVDHIIPFDADTPMDLIKLVKPDFYVKGGDYTHETLPEASLIEKQGGKVEILPYLDDHSTSSVIDRIRKMEVKTRG